MDSEEARKGASLLTQYTMALNHLGECASAIEATKGFTPGVDSVISQIAPIQVAIGDLIIQVGAKLTGCRVGEHIPAQKLKERPLWLAALLDMWANRSVWMKSEYQMVSYIRIDDNGVLQEMPHGSGKWSELLLTVSTSKNVSWLPTSLPWEGIE